MKGLFCPIPHPTLAAMTEEPYEPLYLAGIEHFNACEFFEAHEVWEELWQEYQGPARKFYQGLIQVAVCLHHFGNGNIRGAKKLYHSSRAYLDPYRPHYLGLDLEKLLTELEVCCQEILASDEEYPKIEIVPDLIPEIHLKAAP
jgi:predicted metal-dependent hydrolase